MGFSEWITKQFGNATERCVAASLFLMVAAAAGFVELTIGVLRIIACDGCATIADMSRWLTLDGCFILIAHITLAILLFKKKIVPAFVVWVVQTLIRLGWYAFGNLCEVVVIAIAIEDEKYKLDPTAYNTTVAAVAIGAVTILLPLISKLVSLFINKFGSDDKLSEEEQRILPSNNADQYGVSGFYIHNPPESEENKLSIGAKIRGFIAFLAVAISAVGSAMLWRLAPQQDTYYQFLYFAVFSIPLSNLIGYLRNNFVYHMFAIGLLSKCLHTLLDTAIVNFSNNEIMGFYGVVLALIAGVISLFSISVARKKISAFRIILIVGLTLLDVVGIALQVMYLANFCNPPRPIPTCDLIRTIALSSIVASLMSIILFILFAVSELDLLAGALIFALGFKWHETFPVYIYYDPYGYPDTKVVVGNSLQWAASVLVFIYVLMRLYTRHKPQQKYA